MRNAEFRKEYDTLKRKFSIPKGEKLKKMLATDEGRRKHGERMKKWESFKKKWNIVFMIGDKPVFKKPKQKKSRRYKI
jgi:hypothetical protein